MKITIAILLFEFFLNPAKADLVFKCLVETSLGQSYEQTIKQTDTKIRLDSPEVSLIRSCTTNMTTVLFHKNRTYFNVDNETLQIFLRFVGGLGPKWKPQDLTATDKTEIINGNKTRELTGVIAGTRVHAFIAQNLPLEEKIKEMARKWRDCPGADALQDSIVAMGGGEFSSGLAIRLVYEVLGKTLNFTLESVEEASLDDGEFTVPNDYGEVQFPFGH